MKRKVLIIIATFNEVDNIEGLIDELLGLCLELDILIVDDSSPDGTGVVADRISLAHRAVHVVHRRRREGLGLALVDAFRWAIERRYWLVVNIDGDLSHNPQEVPSLISAAEHCDLVVGSRYSNGIRVRNWPLRRLLLSIAAGFYVRKITGMRISDPTSGFRAYRLDALEHAMQDEVFSKGFAIHVELLFRCCTCGMRVTEVPIVFSNRSAGMTKLDVRVVYEGLLLPWRLVGGVLFRGFTRRYLHDRRLVRCSRDRVRSE